MSNQVVYFVTEEKIKNFTAVHENVAVHDILPHVNDAQNIYLQELLGSTFFYSLQDDIVNSSLSSTNTDLINDYIAPFVLNAALYQMIPFNYVKFRNKGLLKGESEEAVTAELKDVQYFRDSVRTTMEFYRERLRRQLTVFSYLYPEYVAASLTQNMNPNRRQDYSRGMSIPRRGSKTMNQQYGIPIEKQGDQIYGGDPYGCDGCEEKYGAASPTNP
jgi:hypothetical protein